MVCVSAIKDSVVNFVKKESSLMEFVKKEQISANALKDGVESPAILKLVKITAWIEVIVMMDNVCVWKDGKENSAKLKLVRITAAEMEDAQN
jgi:hypothetical protein